MRSDKAFVITKTSGVAETYVGEVVYQVTEIDSPKAYTNDRMKIKFGNDAGLLSSMAEFEVVPEEVYNSPLYKAMQEEE